MGNLVLRFSNYAEYETWMYYNLTWRKKFVWWPQRCYRSKKMIWIAWGYNGQKTSYYRPEIISIWHSQQEHFMWSLTNEN